MSVGDRDPVRGPSPLHLGRILEACERRNLGERADVVAALDLADRGDDRRRPDAVADAKPRQAVELRERSQGEHVVTGADEIRDRVEAVGRIEVVEVRLVDHRQDVLRQVADERDQLLAPERRGRWGCSGSRRRAGACAA